MADLHTSLNDSADAERKPGSSWRELDDNLMIVEGLEDAKRISGHLDGRLAICALDHHCLMYHTRFRVHSFSFVQRESLRFHGAHRKRELLILGKIFSGC